MLADSMIRLENINKTYHNGSPLHVLKGIDLEIGEGEMVSIMGASGSRTYAFKKYHKIANH